MLVTRKKSELKAGLIPHNKPTIGHEEVEAVSETLSDLELTLGDKVEVFEKEFSKTFNRPSVATSSGTSALHLALIALGISGGDEVIVPSYTCIAVGLPVLYQGVNPILADIEEDYNISVDEIKRKIGGKTKAVIVPHMFGYPADMTEIREVCDEKGIYLIEDCAQAIGAEYYNKRVGTLGDISIHSFYATKMMTSIQGGMVSTENPEWIQTIKDLRYHDQVRADEDFDERIKYSYMMSDVSAAVGLVQLKKLDDFVEKRRRIAALYGNNLETEITRPIEEEGKRHVYSRYVIRTQQNPLDLILKLRGKNIVCQRMHNPPLHKRKLFSKYNKGRVYPKTEEAIGSSISLPIYPSLTDKEALFVSEAINEFVSR